MRKKILLKLIPIFIGITTIFNCCTTDVDQSMYDEMIGAWHNYYIGTYEFYPDGTFYYDVENSGYILFGDWRIEHDELVLHYEGDINEYWYEISDFSGQEMIMCPLDSPQGNYECEEYVRL